MVQLFRCRTGGKVGYCGPTDTFTQIRVVDFAYMMTSEGSDALSDDSASMDDVEGEGKTGHSSSLIPLDQSCMRFTDPYAKYDSDPEK
jgi:hypothetical protein